MALTPEEQAELASLQSSAAPSVPTVQPPGQPVAQASGLSASEAEELAALQKEHAGIGFNKETGMKVLETAGRGLNWAGGNVRNAIAQGMDLKEQLRAKLEGREPELITREGDTIRALKGEGAGTDEYLDRAGVPKGASLSDAVPGIYSKTGTGFALKKGGMLDPSVRGAAGFVGDVALDPLTYLSGGLSTVAKGGESAALKALLLANEKGLTTGGRVANAVLNPIETLSRKGATSAYTKAFERVDGKLDKPETLGKIAQETGFWGSPSSAADHFEKVNQKAGQEIGDIMQQAADKGASIDIETALQPAREQAQKLRALGTPEGTNLADQIEARIDQLKEANTATGTYGAKRLMRLPVDEANKVKSNLNSFTNFNPSDVDAIANQGRKAIASPLSSSIKGAVSDADQELFDRLMQANDRFSSTSPKVQKKFENFAAQTAQQRGPFGVTKVDAMLGGLGLSSSAAGHSEGLAPLVLKKMMDATQSFEGRTARGALLNKVGQNSSGLTDEALRQALWLEALKKQGEKNEKSKK